MTKVWAHRGASFDAPENTLEAFLLAADQGADGIELDVQRCKSGELVVIHDDTIDRTADRYGAVAEMTLEELLQADFSYEKPGYQDVRIPLLSDVLPAMRGRGLYVNVEIKPVPEPGIEGQVLDAIYTHGDPARTIISSFSHTALSTLRHLDKNIRLGALYSSHPKKSLSTLFQSGQLYDAAYARRNGFDALHPQMKLVTPSFVYAARAAGVALHVWTPDSKSDLQNLIGLGVDAVITNLPARALKLRGDA